MNQGYVIGYVGGMFAAKTASMLNEFERASLAKKSIICFKPNIDKRFGENIVKSRASAMTIKAEVLPVDGTEDDFAKVIEMTKNKDVIGFDESQFFGDWIVNLAIKLRESGKKVIFNGLDMTFEGKPFLSTALLMGIADKVVKLHAVCVCCGADATFSQKLINGKPVKDGNAVDVEDVSGKSEITYEARCINCFVSPEKAKNV